MPVSTISTPQYKSPLRVVVRFIENSRQSLRTRLASKNEEISSLRRHVRELQREGSVLRQQSEALQKRVSQLEVERAQPKSIELPVDPPLKSHTFGAKMISLCINLATDIGFRPVESVLTKIFSWLGVSARVPEWTTVRTWLCRYGVATLEKPLEPASDWVWMADHSNQIGKEKLLVILGTRAGQLPPRGEPIRRKDMHVLSLVSGTQWKRDDVAREYVELAKRHSFPMAILSDGAVELGEPVKTLSQSGFQVVHLTDFKHYAANAFRKLLENDERFKQFMSELGRSRSAIQQTELSHFTPPVQKQKARFMNMRATLNWAQMVLWHLSKPNSAGRQGITTKRMNEKLGWLRTYRKDIDKWCRCQNVISECLTFVNDQGIFVGAGAQLDKLTSTLNLCEDSESLRRKLIEFVVAGETKLGDVKRLPMSTEILESIFGTFKKMEKQHNKGGFTSLISTFAALLRPATPQLVREAFSRVSTKAMREWCISKLGKTLRSRKLEAYREFRSRRNKMNQQ